MWSVEGTAEEKSCAESGKRHAGVGFFSDNLVVSSLLLRRLFQQFLLGQSTTRDNSLTLALFSTMGRRTWFHESIRIVETPGPGLAI
jgi:hypothetical protein